MPAQLRIAIGGGAAGEIGGNRMGLLPPLEGLYRDDLWCHEPDLWERYRDRPDWRRVPELRGVLLSHAHVDHSGCLGFLKPEIPVYTGLISAVIGKCLQDPRPTGPLRAQESRRAAERGEWAVPRVGAHRRAGACWWGEPRQAGTGAGSRPGSGR